MGLSAKEREQLGYLDHIPPELNHFRRSGWRVALSSLNGRLAIRYKRLHVFAFNYFKN